MGFVIGLHGLYGMRCAIDLPADFCAREADEEYGVG